MQTNLFDYMDYRNYLKNWIQGQPAKGRGIRGKIAQALDCQGTFISQVVHKDAHFNLEHGQKLNEFLSHNKEESHYFILLILHERAGTKSLQEYFFEQIDAIHQHRLKVKSRIKESKQLGIEETVKYYSAWYYGAVRLLIEIPEFQTKQAIAEKLNLKIDTINNALDFLCEHGLAVQNGNRFSIGQQHMYLSDDSPLTAKHLMNWRMRAMSAIDQMKKTNLHFSMAGTLAKEDIVKIKAMLVDNIENMQKVIKPSEPETLFNFNIDFYEI